MSAESLQPVREFVKLVLGTFIEERIQRFPNKPALVPFLHQGKAHLAISHDVCEVFLRLGQQKASDPLFGEVYAALTRSPLRNTQRFFCALQLINAYETYLINPSGLKSWFYLISEGACDIYGQSYDLCVKLINESSGGLGDEPADKAPLWAVRFADRALRDVFAELQCGQPHINASLAALQVFAELYAGSTKSLDRQGMIQVGDWLIANNWETR